jgi:acyl-CoA synthetase (AMP-forming)/AMP-acid ligase II
MADFEVGSSEDPRGDLAFGTIPGLVEWSGQRFADAEALVDGDVRMTFAELSVKVDEVARGLIALGVDVGDRVAIWAPNCHEWVLGALGAVRAGAAIVTLNTRYKGGEAAFILRTSGAKWLLSVRGFLGVDFPQALVGEDVGDLSDIVILRGGAEGPAPDSVRVRTLGDLIAAGEAVSPESSAARAAGIEPNSVCDLVFTSGTTGQPKGAMTTHAQTLRTFATWASIVGLRAGDRYLVVNPFFHTFGYKAGLLASLMAGATVVPEPVFDVDAVLDRIAQESISMLPGPPTLYQSILAHPRRGEVDLSTLRLGVTGAAVVPVELVIAMREELGFETVLTAYGLTESTGVVSMCRRDDDPETIATTSGRAIPDIEVRIIDPEGAEVPRGTAGEVVVRGYTVMPGYFENPEETKKTIDVDGWLHTGDVATMDEAGNLVITDRIKDMYVTGGFNAYPAEIEAILRGFDGISQVAVIGLPDDRMGEIGCAVIVRADNDARDDETFSAEVMSWARDAMANFKVPRRVELVAELPVNASGKVLKRELRERFGS